MKNLPGMVLLLLCCSAAAQSTSEPAKKQKFEVLGIYESGQPDASIFKLYDKASNVICYLLTPDLAIRKSGEAGWSYEGNSLGSLSCVKDLQAVIPVKPREK